MNNLKVKSHSFPMPGNSNVLTIIFPSDPLHVISLCIIPTGELSRVHIYLPYQGLSLVYAHKATSAALQYWWAKLSWLNYLLRWVPTNWSIFTFIDKAVKGFLWTVYFHNRIISWLKLTRPYFVVGSSFRRGYKKGKWWRKETWLGAVNPQYNIQFTYYRIVHLKPI